MAYWRERPFTPIFLSKLVVDFATSLLHPTSTGKMLVFQPFWIASAASRSPLTTHFEALIMIPIAIMKANREMVHPAIMPTSSGCQHVVKPDVVMQNCRSWK
ncbi:uncharacterized [Tachysurus ichikawai]